MQQQMEGAQPSSPRHLVLPGQADAPQALVPIPEPSLVDVLLCVSAMKFTFESGNSM